VDHQQLHLVQTAMVMETQEVKVDQARQRSLAAAAVEQAERVAMQEQQGVEMVALD
jgi:hypothetical protein